MLEIRERTYQVSELTKLIKETLEQNFFLISVEGEISNCRPSSTGHLYFTLKDRDAMISAVMFKGRLRSLTFSPEDGQKVKVRGSLSVYAKRGSYQIICETMEQAGEGDILQMLEQRKRRLAAEGLFDSEKKKPLPMFPKRVAVVTSPTGAALRDIIRVLRRRNAGLNLVVLPTQVQGDTAGPRIAEQIDRANTYAMADVIIVGRGGGSLEDLLPFSDEVVVRAIAESSIPVISAVGHEVDTSLSDLAADMRAPTPSAAAEIVSSTAVELIDTVKAIRENLERTLSVRTDRIRLLLNQFTPDELERHFRILLQPHLIRLDDAKEDLVRNLSDRILEQKHHLAVIKRELEAQSPKAILEKGYAVVTDCATGDLVTDASLAPKNTEINITLHKGRLTAQVKENSDENL